MGKQVAPVIDANVLTSAVPHRSEWRRRRTTEEDADNDRSEGGAAVVQTDSDAPETIV